MARPGEDFVSRPPGAYSLRSSRLLFFTHALPKYRRILVEMPGTAWHGLGRPGTAWREFCIPPSFARSVQILVGEAWHGLARDFVRRPPPPRLARGVQIPEGRPGTS